LQRQPRLIARFGGENGKLYCGQSAQPGESTGPTFQRRILEFERILTVSVPRGVPDRQLLRFVLSLTPEDAQLMREAIEQGCEKIDSHVDISWTQT
jgi:hypothetical protein